MSSSQKSVSLETCEGGWKVRVGENGDFKERIFPRKEEAERFKYAEEIRLGLRD